LTVACAGQCGEVDHRHTMHHEARFVFVLNCVEGCIPSDLGTGTASEIEEELCFDNILNSERTRLISDNLNVSPSVSRECDLLSERVFRSSETAKLGHKLIKGIPLRRRV
jgi:hypothetical protein